MIIAGLTAMRGYPGPGWGVAVSSPSSPAHSALQPAYSSPHVAEANIYAEVAEYEAARGPDTDTEMDSGFTETESGSGDRSAYTSSAGSTGHPATYLHDTVSQVRHHANQQYYVKKSHFCEYYGGGS